MRRVGFLSIAVLAWLAVALVLVAGGSSAAKVQPGCPYYPGAEVARWSVDETTYVSGDAFGQVLKWYEGQHRGKGEVEATAGHVPDAGDITAAYGLLIKHDKDATRYRVTVYKFRGDPHTFIGVIGPE